MKSPSFSISVVMFLHLFFADSASCEHLPDQPQSADSRVLTAVDQHATDVRSLERKFLDSFENLKKSYSKERKELQDELLVVLNQKLKTATKKGDLDQALAIRNHIREIEASVTAPPSSGASHSLGRVTNLSSQNKGILGRWRWNNGVDITNLPGGRMSGNGTWRPVNPQSNTYEIRWKNIPPDRVQLSANGRVLEGTKSHDSSFRVWAVRIN